MTTHYTFAAEVARQRQAEYVAQAAARRCHRTVRRDHSGRLQTRKHWPRPWHAWHPRPQTVPAEAPSN